MNGPGTDILTLLCRANMASDLPESQRLTDRELAENAPIFVIAGTDVTTRAITHILHRIATNPAVQSKLRTELMTLGSDPGCDDLSHLPYLSAAVEEALRLDNPYLIFARKATRACEVPLRYPVNGKDGQILETVKVAKGTEVRIAVRNVHTNADLYGPDADAFRPERFLDGSWSPMADAGKELHATWGSTVSFCGGGRGCPVYNFPLAAIYALKLVMIPSFKLSEPEGQEVEVLLSRNMVQEIVLNGKRQRSIPFVLERINHET